MNEYELAFTSELKNTPIKERKTVTSTAEKNDLIELEKTLTIETMLGNGDKRSAFHHTDTSFKNTTLSELTVVEPKKYAGLSTIVSTHPGVKKQEKSELLMLEEKLDGVWVLEASFDQNENRFMITIKFYDADEYALAKKRASEVVTTKNNFKTGRMICDMATEAELMTRILLPSGRCYTKYIPKGKEGYLEFLRKIYQKGVMESWTELSANVGRKRTRGVEIKNN